ncbi:GlcG/HbpS family heme-binding protein [Devosia sp.]|uniref:GlcG/HbpS family heme-binding protein n=1 Tax=Devosia sp. TaxID=1871048 RepID=UPI0019E1B41D|nr:heme-binding protein [Devosia sp.]MBE0580416.1 heme-binding protein [Devosia sp.]
MSALIRHKAVLTTATAERLAQAGLAYARSNSMVVAVAVVDDGGAAIVLIRMDGANPAVADLALDKAHTSANTGAPTEAFGELMLSRPGLALGLSNRPRLLTWGGGVPVRVDGHVVGAIGVSGGPEDDDIACARAALAALDLG